MKYLALLCLAGPVLFIACSNPNREANSSRGDSLSRVKDSDSTNHAFFPVADYLEGEILHVDSSLLALHEFRTRNGHTDSAFIQVSEFNRLALEFVPKELADSSFEKYFTESSFEDRATNSITFTYSSTNKDLALQRVDVLTVAGPRAQQVKSVYLEKNQTAGDSATLKKLYWRSGQSFVIATLIRVKGAPASEEQVRVVWNNAPEEE